MILCVYPIYSSAQFRWENNENVKKHIVTYCEENAVFFYVKLRGIDIQHWTL